MIYETFLETVRSMMQERLDPGSSVELRRILKNNGIRLDALSFTTPGIPFCPTVYLDSFYEEFEEGTPLPEIISRIFYLYEKHQLPDGLELKLTDPALVRRQIAYKLIGTVENETLLSDVPHYRYLDLAVVFYLIVAEDSSGQMTALIHHKDLEHWKLTGDQLLNLAKDNTPSLLPPQIRPIEDVILNHADDDGQSLLGQEALPPVCLYVLTNQSELNGAACLLYPDILKNFADKMEDDLIILPSSIHEVLLTPAKNALDGSDLNDMVEAINQSDVPPEDRLANHIYYYDRSRQLLLNPFTSFEESEKLNP